MQDIQQVISQLINTYQGPTWYGKNIERTLHEAPIGKALLRLKGSYNIVELVHHMLAWRAYAIDLLETGVHQDVPEFVNFPTVEVMMMEDWSDLLKTFADTQERLVELLSSTKMDFNDFVPGKEYTFLQVFQGLVHHDIYHAGQINLLAKFL
jgi:hypothetical protein